MKKRVLDLIIVCFCMAVIGIVLLYPDQVTWRNPILILACILAVLFLLLAVRDKEDRNQYMEQPGYGSPGKDGLITEDVRENQVDIDLGQSPYASMVDIEHAVLNYSAGNWYVEDLGSSNGISIKKASDGRVYRLSRDTACRLERGDCLYIGLNHLLLK